MSEAKKLTTSYTTFEPSRLDFTVPEENDRSKHQLIGYPRFNHPTLGENQALMLQFPWIHINTFGIPREGEYYKTDADRAFIKTPFQYDHEEFGEQVKILGDKIKELDKIWGSDKKKKELFGKKWKKYKFTANLRESNFDEDDEDAVRRPDYMKLKFDTSWPDHEILTKVYTSVLGEDGKRKREPVEVSTVNDVANVVTYQSKIRPIVRPVKIWAQLPNRSDPLYGIVWKIVKIEVEPSDNSGGSLYKSYYNNDAFLDSDDDDDEAEVTNNNNVMNEDVDDSSDSSDDSSDEEEIKVKAKSKKKGKKKNL